MGSAATLQLIANQSEPYPALALQEFATEALRRTTVTPRLDEDIDHVTVLIHGTPQILPLAVDRDKDFVQKPRIPESTLSPLQALCLVGIELPTPLSDGLVGNDDSALGKKIFHIPKAQAKPIVVPDGMANDFGRISVSVIGRSAAFHRLSLPAAAQLDNTGLTLLVSTNRGERIRTSDFLLPNSEGGVSLTTSEYGGVLNW